MASLPKPSPRLVRFLYIVFPLVAVRGDNINFPTPLPSKSSMGGVWPLPQKQDLQDQYVAIVDSFRFKVVGKSCDILDDAVTRYKALLKTNWRDLTKYDLVNTAPNVVGKINKLKIRLRTPCEKYPYLNADEKYTLEISKGISVLEAESIWGILRGLETFCQLPVPAPNEDQLLIQVQKIEDFPQYPHRGLLIDTSRHYLSLSTIKKQLDIMSYNKLNVLHWHIVDDQSFPYESKKFPLLSQKGAFGGKAVYTERNIQEIVEYARLRGIRVIPEFDTPGHTDSMESGMPDVHCHVPHNDKTFVGPLDPTKNSTFEFMHDLLAEVNERFPDSYVHLGGDEVDEFCWTNDPTIAAFMKTRNWSTRQLQSYYMQNILKDVKAMSSKAIVWEEVFNTWQQLNKNSGSSELSVSMDKDTIVQTWKGYTPECVKTVAAAGFKVINSCGWYLSDITRDFHQFYYTDTSAANLTDEEKKFFLGGEACMWGEKVDDTNIESRVWPRACAIAEHLWSAPHPKSDNDTSRITEHVCRLRRRDVKASPVDMISYCSDVLPRPNFGEKFLTLNSIRETLGLDSDDDNEEETYTIVKNNSTEPEKSTAEKSNASSEENPTADAPVDDKSAAMEAFMSLAVLISSLAVWYKISC